MFWRRSSEMRPASAIEPPDGSSTVDLAWRFFSAGIEIEAERSTAPTFDSSLTSLSILRLMRPSRARLGVKATPTPNSL